MEVPFRVTCMSKSKNPPFIDQPLNLQTHKMEEEMNLNLHVNNPNSRKKKWIEDENRDWVETIIKKMNKN